MQYSCGYGIHPGSGRSELIIFSLPPILQFLFGDEVLLILSHWSCCLTAFKTWRE